MEPSYLNRLLAENLRAEMDKRGWVQETMASKSGIGQTTVALYLHPERRKPGKDGKPGSAKLTEVEFLASALGVKPWELLRPFSGAERAVYERIQAAMDALQDKNESITPSLPATSDQPAKARKTSKAES